MTSGLFWARSPPLIRNIPHTVNRISFPFMKALRLFFPDEHQTIPDGEHNFFYRSILFYILVKSLYCLGVLVVNIRLQHFPMEQHIVGDDQSSRGQSW